MLTLDFETALAMPGLQAPPPVCLAAVSESSPAEVYKDDQMDVFQAALESGEPLVFLYGPFDLRVAANARPDLLPLIFQAYDEDRIFDVTVRQKLIDIATGDGKRFQGQYSMQDLAWRLLKEKIEKEDTWRLRYWELINVPLCDWPEDAIEYPKKDVITTRAIFQVQENDLAEVNRLCVLADQHRQCRADFALGLASAWGLRTDKAQAAKLRADSEKQLLELQDSLLENGLLRWQKKKGVMSIAKCQKKAQERMLAVDPEARLTKKGVELTKEGVDISGEAKYISVDAEACRDSGDALLEQYSSYAQTSKFLTGAMKTLEMGADEPIHTRFEVLLDTGRTSSSKPPLQNLSRKPGVRECFKPRDGWVFVATDFDKAELHTLAQVCINLFGRSCLAEVLNNGFDPHIGLGARLAGTTYDGLAERIKAKDKEAKEWRQRAKPGNFGFPGGMGPEGMVRYAKGHYGVILTLDEADDLRESWREEYPVVAYDYLGWIGDIIGPDGYTTIEHFDSHRWRGRVKYCNAANSFFQGMSADGMKRALWKVTKKCYLPGTALYGCRVVNEVHDEIIIEAPETIASDAAWEMRDTMVQAYNHFTRDVPVNATPALMDRWSKSAETLIDSHGNLQVWRYKE
jgi:DNA polymerase-1